jgi:hypothetical protein
MQKVMAKSLFTGVLNGHQIKVAGLEPEVTQIKNGNTKNADVQKMLKVSAWHLSQSKLGEGEQRFRSPLQTAWYTNPLVAMPFGG